MIPSEFTCEGENCNPPLEWKEVPEGTKSFAIIMDDPDSPGGTWLHWAIWNIPSEARSITKATTPIGALEGKTSFGNIGYGGPCPSRGEHRYYFRLFALDVELAIARGNERSVIEQALIGHVLADSELMGRYEKIRH